MRQSTKHLVAFVVVGIWAVCGVGAAWADSYTLATTIALPASSANVQTGGAVTSFGVSFAASNGYVYIADRSNAAVDILNGATNTFISRATGFVGQQSMNSMSGPNGVVVVQNGSTYTLYAGDGSSTLRSFDVTTPTNPIAGGTVNTGGGSFAVNGLAYSAANRELLAANSFNSPAYGSLISTTSPLTPTLTTTNLTVPGQVVSGGLGQPVWDPNTGSFFVTVPTFNGTDAGGVQEFSADGTPLRTFNFSSLGVASCSPTGIGLGASGNLMVGCGNTGTQTLVLNPSGTGSILTQSNAVSGTNEIWYDPTSGDYAVTGVNNTGDRVIDLFADTNYALLQSIDLTTLGSGKGLTAGSVTIDPLNGEIFVPLRGSSGTATDTLCPNGCVAVFTQQQTVSATPEPGSLVLLATGFVALTGAGVRRWRRA